MLSMRATTARLARGASNKAAIHVHTLGAAAKQHVGSKHTSAAATLQITHRSQQQQRLPIESTGTRWHVALAAAAIAAAASSALLIDPSAAEASRDTSNTPAGGDERLEYAQVVDAIRKQVSEFRMTLTHTDARLPKAFPMPKIGISRTNAPNNNNSTIRIEFAIPPFVDHEALLARFLHQLQTAKQVVEVVPMPLTNVAPQSIEAAYDQPAVSFVYANGHGSFQFVRDANAWATGSTFVFFKDDFVTTAEVQAVVAAYKELYSFPHVHAFVGHELSQQPRRKMIAGQSSGSSAGLNAASSSKDEAIQQLEALGIDVFEATDGDNAVNWDSLAGYDNVKLEIEDTVVLALQNPELYEAIARKTRCRYESNRPRAVLFEGPPGTGKTLSARIIAQQAGIPMIHIPIESVVSKWYGDSEKKMSAIFDACEKLDGAIIFIDEIDALAGDRSGGTMHEASRRILSVLLQKVEGFSSAKKTTVICATNRKQDLDSALISRFDLCIRYDLPDDATRKAVFARYAKQLPHDELAQLAAISSGLSCRDIKEICEYAERKWASKVLKKEETRDVPTLDAYVEATKVHTLGIGSHGLLSIYDA